MYSEIKALLNSLKPSVLRSSFFHDEFNTANHEKYPCDASTLFLEQNKINVSMVKKRDGNGLLEVYYKIYKFETETESCFVQFDGYYTSYKGSEFQEFFCVKPVEVTVTQYQFQEK